MQKTMLALSASLALMLPAQAGFAQAGGKEPTTGERAKGIATQPLEDLNLHKEKIPDKLLTVQEDPYSLKGIRTCKQINGEIVELDAVLGPDVDADDSDGPKTVDRVIDVGGSLLGSIIPFRGVVREVTGANAERRRYQTAIYSGVTRRSYLKGMGKARGCKAPPRPVIVAQVKDDDKADKKDEGARDMKDSKPATDSKSQQKK